MEAASSRRSALSNFNAMAHYFRPERGAPEAGSRARADLPNSSDIFVSAWNGGCITLSATPWLFIMSASDLCDFDLRWRQGSLECHNCRPLVESKCPSRRRGRFANCKNGHRHRRLNCATCEMGWCRYNLLRWSGIENRLHPIKQTQQAGRHHCEIGQ